MKKFLVKQPLCNLCIIVVALPLFIAACSLRSESPVEEPTQTEPAPTVTISPATATPTITPSPTPDVVQGTLTIWHSWQDDQMPILDQILQQFSAQYPDVLLDVLYLPQENLRARFESAALDGAGADILLGPAEWGAPLYQAGLVSDLSDLAESALLGKLNPPALEAARYKDALVGMPYAQQGVVLYRNEALIPSSPATFDELVSLSKAATQGEIIGANLETSLFFSGGHLNGLGGRLMDADGVPAFNDQGGLAWLELLKTLEQAGPTNYLSDQDLDLFKEGRVGWIIDGTWNLAALIDALGVENLAIDPWPSYRKGSLSGFVQPFNLYLSPNTRDDERKAAWMLIQHMLSPESQELLNEAGLLPVVSGATASDPVKEILIAQALTALEGGSAYPSAPEMAFYLTPLENALQAALSGNTPFQEALSVAEGTILQAISQANATPTPAP